MADLVNIAKLREDCNKPLSTNRIAWLITVKVQFYTAVCFLGLHWSKSAVADLTLCFCASIPCLLKKKTGKNISPRHRAVAKIPKLKMVILPY